VECDRRQHPRLAARLVRALIPWLIIDNDEEYRMNGPDARQVARIYLDAWRTRDFDRLRTVLADDVTFRGPLGAADGAEECLAGLRAMAEKIMTDIDIKVMAVDGPNVLTWFELHSASANPIPTVNWSQVEDGLITRIRVTFDPRPLLPATTS
jgi:limonene-1,2-epoxide hydrolase